MILITLDTLGNANRSPFMHMKQYRLWLRNVLILPIALLTACAVGPDYVRPPIDVAEKFRMAPLEGESVANLRWWELLQDETLQHLIRQALQENKNLRQAVATVEEFEARLNSARMGFIPNMGGPPSKAKYSLPPIADSTVRER